MTLATFEALFEGSSAAERRTGLVDRRRPLVLPDLAVARPSAPQATDEAPATAPLEPVPPASLTFSEGEVARACAAAATAARRAAIDEDTLRQRDIEERLGRSLRASLGDLLTEAERRRQVSERSVVELVGAVLHAVLLDSPAMRAEVIVGALRGCLADMPDARDLLLRASPSETDTIAAKLVPLLADPAAAATTRVVADDTLRPGEVRLAWRDSWIELDLPDWLAQVRARLEQALFSDPNA